MEIGIELPAVRLGVLDADAVCVRLVDEGLASEMDAVCARVRGAFTVEALAEHAPIRAVREMFRRWGLDPSKYRPSSEALMRRVVQGKGLYRMSNVVDIGNVGSIETGWPFGCYDRGKLRPPIAFRHGAAEEKYEGIGKRMWHLEGRPVLADASGPFGSPISDSTRSMITESAKGVMVVIYAPAGTADFTLQNALDRLADRLSRFAGAKISDSVICG
jgi:DNA/RNA-binding domain of Phe-tRNA-synthetase-like protein